MENILKYLVIVCFLFFYNDGFSQCYCDDLKVIELKDTIVSGEEGYFTFKMTSDSSNCSGGYSDFWFINQVGDTINQWTGAGMWLPMPLNSIFDTTEYIIELRPEYSNFPTDFSGNLQILNPDCTIPLDFTLSPTEGVFDLELDIQISPNPSSDEIRILNKSDIVISTLEIYNSMGKLLILENESTDSIRINTLVPGIYYVRIYSNKRVIAIKKLIKI